MLLNFNIRVKKGTESPYEWYTQKIKDLAKEKYGINLIVEINPKYLNEKKDLSDTQ